MSFQCGQCNQTSKPGTSMTRVVVEKRDRQYMNERGQQSEGWEIKKEIPVCSTCMGTRTPEAV